MNCGSSKMDCPDSVDINWIHWRESRSYRVEFTSLWTGGANRVVALQLAMIDTKTRLAGLLPARFAGPFWPKSRRPSHTR